MGRCVSRDRGQCFDCRIFRRVAVSSTGRRAAEFPPVLFRSRESRSHRGPIGAACPTFAKADAISRHIFYEYVPGNLRPRCHGTNPFTEQSFFPRRSWRNTLNRLLVRHTTLLDTSEHAFQQSMRGRRKVSRARRGNARPGRRKLIVRNFHGPARAKVAESVNSRGQGFFPRFPRERKTVVAGAWRTREAIVSRYSKKMPPNNVHTCF